jgi:5-methylcytosine-specific restriction enzyme A
MFSVKEYEFALSQSLTESQLKMLRLNYVAPNSTITATQMAWGMGWQRFGAANMHYGKLGRLIAKRIGRKIEPYKNGKTYPISVLVDFDSIDIYAEHFEWILWDNLITALGETGLIAAEQWRYPDEVTEAKKLMEGTTYITTVNIFERNPIAREACIQYHGSSCYICGFNFGVLYGDLMMGFIHVHHLRPLSEIREEYVIDPIQDLRPVCPNCHAVVHSRRPAYSPEEVCSMLQGVSR